MSRSVAAALLLMLAPACGGDAPVPLPERALLPPAVDARMASDGAVRGYLARPVLRPGAGEVHPGLLVVVPTLDDTARAEARDRAEAGAVVLTVAADQDLDRARRWLAGMSGVSETRCEGCPPSPDAP